MKKFFFVFPLSIIAGLLLGFRFAPQRTVVDVRDNVIAYADGTAEIAITDDVPMDLPTHTFSKTVAALGDGPYFRVPNLVARGSTWERDVYTYDDPMSDNCQRNIFYMDRVQKTVKHSQLDYCVTETANRDATHFVAMSMDNETIAVGRYENGAITATHAVPVDMALSGIVFNWEITKAALHFVDANVCGPDPDCTQRADEAYLWNLTTGEWKQVPLPTYTTLVDTTKLQYNHDNDTFEFSARLIIGTVYVHQANFVDKVTELK